MTRKTLWQLLLYSVGNSNRILRHSRLSSLKILGVNSAFLETFTFLLFSREFFLSILTEIRQTSGKVKQETGKVIQEIQEHLLWVTVWFLSVVFLGSSLNRLNPTQHWLTCKCRWLTHAKSDFFNIIFTSASDFL